MPQQLPAKNSKKTTPPPKGKPASSQQYLDVAQIRDGVVVIARRQFARHKFWWTRSTLP